MFWSSSTSDPRSFFSLKPTGGIPGFYRLYCFTEGCRWFLLVVILIIKGGTSRLLCHVGCDLLWIFLERDPSSALGAATGILSLFLCPVMVSPVYQRSFIYPSLKPSFWFVGVPHLLGVDGQLVPVPSRPVPRIGLSSVGPCVFGLTNF